MSNLTSKKNKVKVAFAASLALGTTLCIGNIHNAAAATVTNIENNLNKIGSYYYGNSLAGTKPDGMYTLDKKYQSISSRGDIFYTPDSDNFKLNKTQTDLIYVGENTFHNTSDVDQTNSTTTFSKEVVHTSTSTTTKGFTMSNQGLEFKLPLFIGSNKITTTINSSKTNGVTESIKETLTAPAQSVKVPAHKVYKTVVQLEQVQFQGVVDYSATGKALYNDIKSKGMWISYNGTPYRKKFDLTNSIGTAWSGMTSAQKNSVQGIKINSNNNTMIVDGEATVTGVTGSNMIIKTYDITNNQNILVKESRV